MQLFSLSFSPFPFSLLPLLALLIPRTSRPTADRTKGSKDQKGRMSRNRQRNWGSKKEGGLSKKEKREERRTEPKKRVTGNHRYIFFRSAHTNARPETWVLGEGVRRDQGWAWRRRYLNERRRAGKKRERPKTRTRATRDASRWRWRCAGRKKSSVQYLEACGYSGCNR